ncbi:hypothetical protein ACFVY9_00425 [Streptomyces sp. NPDC059544]|uniref:hypothetical protein n=1 Tax=Streptomyces sp. NPDC059544 TaxID=3346861 RepID=UPI003698E0C8
MLIVYAPKDGEKQTFDARSLKVSEASIAQRTIDRPWGEIQKGVEEEDLEAMRVVAWVVKKRSHPSLRYAELDPGIEELYARLDKDEVENWLNAALAVASMNQNLTPEKIRSTLAPLPYLAYDQEHAERLIEDALADPKGEPAPEESELPNGTPTSEPPTSGTSDSSATS